MNNSEYKNSEGSGSAAKVLLPKLVLDLSVKKARGQLLGGRYKQDFWVPGEKGRCKEGERGAFCYALEEEKASCHVRSQKALQAGGQRCLAGARWD